MNIHRSMNLRSALAAAVSYGVDMRQGKGGEVVITFPGHHPIRFNARRKDTPRILIVRLRDHAAAVQP